MHVAIIMDGNGRWAQRRGLPRSAGHKAGARAVRRVVEAAAAADVDLLTLYAFSSDNWNRPATEVNTLMHMFKQYLQSEIDCCIKQGIRLNIIGRRDRLPLGLMNAIARAERTTADGTRLTLRIALDYSARDAILRAANGEEGAFDPLHRQGSGTGDVSAYAAGQSSPDSLEGFTDRLARVTHSLVGNAGVDLLIRSGGEQRLSDFLLWECAYAELVFAAKLWPDFDAADLLAALDEFRSRERRYGGLPDAGPVRAAGGTA